jgi:OmpA-OmpF porin, OOP family
MTNRCLLGAGVALAVALGGAQAHAQWNMFGPYPPGVFYLGPEGGWTHLGSNTATGSFTSRVPAHTFFNRSDVPIYRSFPFSAHTTYNSGYNAGLRAGYAWGPWRFEEEYSYRNDGLSTISGSIGKYGFSNSGAFSGNVHSNAIMTNAIYDFTFGWPVTPHIGAGVGAVDVVEGISGDGHYDHSILNQTGFGSFNASSWEFGYQAIAGIRYDINPILSVDVDYHFLATPNFTLTGTCPFTEPGFRVCGGRGFSINTGYKTQNIIASLTMKFGAPPPAAPPPAPPAPPPPPVHQVYLVFFDWDRYNITPEGMQIVEAAANHWKSGAAVQIMVTGYTDLSGPPGYNQRLSERRANAVAVALERFGVPRSDMVVAGRGMNDPRVPTALGVREPQNRRVEITFP